MNNEHVPTDSAETLQRLAEEIESEIAELRSGILPLQQRLDAAREKLDLVHRLIHLSSPSNDSTSTQHGSASPSSSPLQLEDYMERILLTAGTPLHIRQIRASLIEMGVPLPGKGDEANIILRLRRASDRFIRTERGTYALAAWNMPSYSPTPRKRKIRRHRTSKI